MRKMFKKRISARAINNVCIYVRLKIAKHKRQVVIPSRRKKKRGKKENRSRFLGVPHVPNVFILSILVNYFLFSCEPRYKRSRVKAIEKKKRFGGNHNFSGAAYFSFSFLSLSFFFQIVVLFYNSLCDIFMLVVSVFVIQRNQR